jgi:HSP20 family protein
VLLVAVVAPADCHVTNLWCMCVWVRCLLPQKPDSFEVTADVPGFTKDQVHVEVQDGFLKLSAERSDRKEDDTERGGVKYHRVERSSGSMMRQVKLPPSADTTRVAAAMENGVLHLTVPKKAEAAAAGPVKVPIA